MKARKVTYAKLHQGIFATDLGGTIGDTLPPINKSLKYELSFDSDGLWIKLGSKQGLVPAANISVMVFAPEETEAKKA